MNAPNYARYPGPGDLPGDSSHPNSPDYVDPDTEVTDELRDELEGLPLFVHEAMQELSPTALARAINDGDEHDLMAQMRDAVSTYADFYITKGERKGESLEQTLRSLLRSYRPRAAA